MKHLAKRDEKCEIFQILFAVKSKQVINVKENDVNQEDYEGHGMEIIAIEEPPPTGQISISSSLNQLG